MYNIDYIINELSYRVTTGKPDFTDHSHLQILVEILEEQRWPETSIVSAIRNILLLAEAGPKQPSTPSNLVKIYLQQGEKAPEGRKAKKGPRGGMYFLGSPREKQSRGSGDKTKKVDKSVSKQTQQPITKKEPARQKQVAPKKQPPVVEPPKVDKKGKYIPSEQDRQVVSKTLKTTSTKTGMLSNPADVKVMSQFEDDVDKLMDTRSKELAKAIVDKYKLSVNRNTELGNSSKLYIGAIDKKYRKIFSGPTGNAASTIIAQVLKDTGAMGERGGYTKKSMTPNNILSDKETMKLEKTADGIKLGPHIIKHAKKYDYKSLKERYVKEVGLSPQQASKTVKQIKKAADRYNFYLDNINSVFGQGDVSVLQVCPECDITTQQGREQTKQATIKKIVDKMKTLSAGTESKEVKDIINDFNSLGSISESKEYQKKLNDIIFKFSQADETKATSADITEMVDYLRLLNEGKMVYLPADSNFALGDIFTLPSKQPTIDDLLKHKGDASSLFTSFEDRSVKKGTGGASASKGKILLTKYKHKDTQKDLLSIIDNYGGLMNKKDYKSSDKLISTLSKKYSKALKSDKDFVSKEKNKKAWFKRNGSKLHDVKAWDRFYTLGYMLSAINRSDIEFQALQNSKYNVTKKGVTHELSDGLNTIAEWEFEISMRNQQGKPLNQYGSRFYHVDYKNKD